MSDRPASPRPDSLLTAGYADELQGQALIMTSVPQSITIQLVIMQAREDPILIGAESDLHILHYQVRLLKAPAVVQ